MNKLRRVIPLVVVLLLTAVSAFCAAPPPKCEVKVLRNNVVIASDTSANGADNKCESEIVMDSVVIDTNQVAMDSVVIDTNSFVSRVQADAR